MLFYRVYHCLPVKRGYKRNELEVFQSLDLTMNRRLPFCQQVQSVIVSLGPQLYIHIPVGARSSENSDSDCGLRLRVGLAATSDD